MQHHRAARVFKVVLIGAAAALVFGLVVMSLWNWLMPALFGLKSIDLWQALGLLLLSWILFGGMRGGHGMHWRHRMHERWAQMTPEERENFRQKMHHRWGDHEPPSS